MVNHVYEIPLDIGFSLTGLLPMYCVCVLKLRYNQNCPFLVQSHISDFQEPCVF